MPEKISKEDFDEFQKWKSDKSKEHETLEVEKSKEKEMTLDDLVSVSDEEPEDYICENCGYKPLNRNMGSCPNCKEELIW